jgi:PIN domain nuclease of toxin-antitoxin system
VRLLLDTHAWLWFYLGDARLSGPARSAIDEQTNDKLVSAASLWELAIKVSLGKYALAETFDEFIKHSLIDNGFGILPVEPAHAARLSTLPYPTAHKDPFDRMLAAQALVEQIPLLSGDAELDAYGISRIW